MVERYVGGRELTCGVMGDEALEIIELITADGGWYDYDSKYSDYGARHVIPAPLSPNIYQSIQNLAVRAHQALGCRGISRADFRYDDRPDGTGQLVCLEVNTQPGMTATSLVPDMARYAGIDFPALVSWMVEDASCGR
jgi:D-alanine-D-alanine ligase